MHTRMGYREASDCVAGEAEALGEWSRLSLRIRLAALLPTIVLSVVLGAAGVYFHTEGRFGAFGFGELTAYGEVYINRFSVIVAASTPGLMVAGIAFVLYQSMLERARVRFVASTSKRLGLEPVELLARTRILS